MSVLARKKQILAPDVDGLINCLTTLERDEEGFQELEKWVYSNIIHHTFATVDIIAVEQSIKGIAEKLRLHGLEQRAKRFEELVEKYVASDSSSHSQLNVQWHVLLLLLKLAHNPSSVPEQALQPSADGSIEEAPSEDIDWPQYLREGLDEFYHPSDTSDEDEWDSSSEEEVCEHAEEQCVAGGGGQELASLGEVPHPALWHRLQPPPPTRQETIRRIIWEGVEAEQWLRAHTQPSWWADSASTLREPTESTHPVAHMCDIWLDNLQGRKLAAAPQIHQVSEYNVIHEVLWMLQVPTDKGLFRLDNHGHFHPKTNLSLHTTIPETTRLVLEELCPYFDIIHKLRQFEQDLNTQELSDTPPPLTYKAYSAALYQQLKKFYQLVICIEERHCAQEETMTLMTVSEELRPGLEVIRYLHQVHARAVVDHHTHPHWLCASRLLSVLYEAILEATDPKYAAPSVDLFIHSFHVYLDIIDQWLSDGRLEDWRKEFLVISEGDVLKVMPYEDEMMRSGVRPVQLLGRLVAVLRDTGDTMEVVSLLNKLPELRHTMQNRGFLFKEFSQNVYDTIHQYIGNVAEEKTEAYEEKLNIAEDENEKEDIDKEGKGNLVKKHGDEKEVVEEKELEDADEGENDVQELGVDLSSDEGEKEDVHEEKTIVKEEEVNNETDNVEKVINEDDEKEAVDKIVEIGSKQEEKQSEEEKERNETRDSVRTKLLQESSSDEETESESSYLSCDKGALASLPQHEDGVAEHTPNFLGLMSSQQILDCQIQGPTNNPFLAAVFSYIHPQVEQEPADHPQDDTQPQSADGMGGVAVMCVHKVLESQLTLVETRYKIASRLVTRTLHTEYCLMRHLDVLRNVFFMESANLAQTFYSYLFKEIESSIRLNSVELSVQLQICVQEYFPEFSKYFSVTVARGDWSDVHQAIPAISVDYRVDWPVSSVITPPMIENYNQVFRFLLHLKYALWTLKHLRFPDHEDCLRARRLQVLRLWMYHSTNTLHSYFMGLVLRSYSADLQHSLQHAHSVHLIVEAHKKFLDQVKVHCLQHKKNDLEKLIIMLLRLCSTLAELWRRGGAVQEADIQRLEERYLTVYRTTATLLEAITDNSDHLDNPLCELKNEIMHSIPEGCYEES